MKLISPSFLKKVNEQWERDRVLHVLFNEEDTISIVMNKKKLSFDEACYWVAAVCYDSEAPEANDSEKEVMKRIAKEFVAEWRENADEARPK